VSLLAYRPPTTWSGPEVSDWLCYIGMERYKRTFVHNAIDGKLLVELTEEDMRAHLHIGVLAHHRYIHQTVKEIT
jgi:hypothetical protein